jgi:hypothetical protein
MSEQAMSNMIEADIADTVRTQDRVLTYIRELVKNYVTLRDKFFALEVAQENQQKEHKNLQEEYQKSQHNLNVSLDMVVQLSEYIKKNGPAMGLYEALNTPLNVGDSRDALTGRIFRAKVHTLQTSKGELTFPMFCQESLPCQGHPNSLRLNSIQIWQMIKERPELEEREPQLWKHFKIYDGPRFAQQT